MQAFRYSPAMSEPDTKPPNVDGARLREVRDAAGLTREDLAALIEHGPNWRTIARVENEGRSSYRTVEVLAKALGLDPAEVRLGDADDPPRPTAMAAGDPAPSWAVELHAKFDELRTAQCEMMRFFTERADANRERMETLIAAIPEQQARAVDTIHEHMDAIWKAAMKQRNEG